MFATLLQFLLSTLGVVPLPAGAGSLIGLAAIAVAVTVLTIAIAMLTPAFGLRLAPHPRRAIDVSTLLAQSDPDAAGHPRPRAPGFALAA